jgi:hypothetical protein
MASNKTINGQKLHLLIVVKRRAKAMEQIVKLLTGESFREGKVNKQEAERPLFFC